MVWYSHLFQNFPQFVVIYTVKGFGVVNEAEVDVFLEFSYFFYDPTDVKRISFPLEEQIHEFVLSDQVWLNDGKHNSLA